MRTLTLPIARKLTLSKWNYWLGRIHDVKLYGKIKVANRVPVASGSANINIIIELLERVNKVDGDITECGVFRGSTIVSIAYYAKVNSLTKNILGFDSFEGFSKEDLKYDQSVSSSEEMDAEVKLFRNNSLQLVKDKLELVGVINQVKLIKGFFSDTLPLYSSSKFSFVHIDCDLYEPYKVCLSFFYSRTSKGGIILFDEYNDPVYTMCNRAIDNFLKDKPEQLLQIVKDNQIKYYIEKL
ncbi:MAG: class I SAM-dependent methyltransferase [Flavobacteriales bacterium]|nr:class I SAM-dependent methyltransferase [Flavobacteriales bacterium]